MSKEETEGKVTTLRDRSRKRGVTEILEIENFLEGGRKDWISNTVQEVLTAGRKGESA